MFSHLSYPFLRLSSKPKTLNKGLTLRSRKGKVLQKTKTRWTFFRVKLVFKCDFETSWSLRPFWPWDFLQTPFTSFLPPSISYCLLVWLGGGEGVSNDYGPFWVLTLEIELVDGPWTFYIYVKKFSGGWVVHLDYNVSSGPVFQFWPSRLRLEMDQDPRLTI